MAPPVPPTDTSTQTISPTKSPPETHTSTQTTSPTPKPKPTTNIVSTNTDPPQTRTYAEVATNTTSPSPRQSRKGDKGKVPTKATPPPTTPPRTNQIHCPYEYKPWYFTRLQQNTCQV
ncbi:hypothetical protein L211DRAFT_889999 [Terfezia boudieri ATCC MYA-4762]|uniref:Uncharacterized protein n=1 Tax=Terfezia boudieri ATCC MYA-4762 TaxID=1051890 RepID=A0A3N4LHT2_9PEZI|nr:hypothetical protein L211DRAFT_889999 [Terfezia boudieri ATCC MYA-4762]